MSVDAGYIDSELLVTSNKNYQIDLIGPAPEDSQWQARAGKGFALTDFQINWENKLVCCPKGKLSATWKPRFNRYQQPVIQVAFQKADCQNCPSQSDCTKAKCGYRTLTLRSEEFHLTLVKARARQKTKDFKKQYAKRAGIEGTKSLRHKNFWITSLPLPRLSQNSITAYCYGLRP
ncbi:MAG: transposase [Prochloraceae cyanobacterium]|nr:transposase [Prochloraceae cyanobacterium]